MIRHPLKRVTVEYQSGVTIAFEGESLAPWYVLLALLVEAEGSAQKQASETKRKGGETPATLADLLKTEKTNHDDAS